MRTHMFLRFLLGLLLFSIHGTTCAQSLYTLRHLGIEDGLSNNYVKDIVQDKQGCIWVATEFGLNRFDGCKFTVYKSSNSQLINDALNVLLYDEAENVLWIGGKFQGVGRLDCSTNEFKYYQGRGNLKIDNIVHLAHAADGGLWLTKHHGEIIHYDKQTGIFSSLSDKGISLSVSSHWCTYDDGTGHLYIGHAQGGMSVVDLKRKAVRYLHNLPDNPQSLPGNSVYTIYKDRLENIWVGTNRGLGLFNPKTQDFTVFKHEYQNPHSLIADHIYDIKEMDDGTLWIASDIGGISILDLHSITFKTPDNVQFYNITADNSKHGVSSGNIRNLLQDSFGNIWIGNYSSGIDFISHTQPFFHILPYMTEHGNILKQKPVWGLYEDEEDRIWLGGENEIALFKDNKLVKSINVTSRLSRPYGQVFSIIGDGHGTLLLGIYDDGLLKFDTRSDQIERIPLDMENVDIITFFKDADQKIWIGAEYGIYSYFEGVLRKEDALTRQLRDKSVYGIVRDRQGKLWVGTYGGGIAIFNKDEQKVLSLNTDQNFFSNAINSLYMDRLGGIWVATRQGLGYIKDTNLPEHFEVYSYQYGLEDTFVRSIKEDMSGNIWLSTNDRIAYWNKQKRKFENYDYRDGIPMGNFIEGSVCRTKDGTLYFGSLNGVCYFSPESLIVERQVAPVQIIECMGLDDQIESRDGETIIPALDKDIELPYNRNSFRVSFSVPDYSQSQQVEYAYLMEGLTNSWTNTLGENRVTFRNISPGEYIFKIKARLRNQEWDDNHIATLKIHIHPPLWSTWYAKIFYLLLLSAGVFVWFRFYKRKLLLESSLELEKKKSQNEQELNNERLRFYTNITHELRTPLTLILGPLEDLINDSQLPDFYNNKIKVIHDSALRLLNLINQILEFRKTETQNRKLTVVKSDLASLVMEIGLRYKELNRNAKVKFHISVDTEEKRLYFDADIITTVLNNLLSNALKYTPEGEIKLFMRSVSEGGNWYTELMVSDTGYGIESQSLPHIFDRYYQTEEKHQASGTGIGLALVKSLADLHEGILNVESEVGKGTTFTFRLLTENTYPDALHKEEKEVIIVSEEEGNVEDEQVDTDTRPMILVVEDNDDIREYIATSFSTNYRILTAADGKGGLEQAQEFIPDIIISDIMMPVMDGIELCKQIKEDVCTSHIPVILLTAKDSIQDKEEGYESGADSYLTKPFSAKLLNSRVHNLLESRKKLAVLIADRAKKLESDSSGQEESMKLNKLDADFIARFTSIVEANIEMNKLDMGFVKDKMRMSHSTLYRKIKGLTGMSGNEFIRKIKLKNSLRLLTEERLNVSEAAYASGFNDLGYFRACFKEEYGMVPSEYIRQLK